MDSIISVVRTCCPCLLNVLGNNNYRQVVQKIKGQTQHEQFMKQTIQPSHYQHRNYSKQNIKVQQTQSSLSSPSAQLMQKQNTQNINKNNSQIYQSQKLYTDCISIQHPYYNILKSKLQILPNIFDLKVQPECKVAENNYNLKIYIKQSQDDRTNIFVYSFQFPTNYDFYQEMQRNFELQKSFDSNIDSYQCKENIEQNTKVIYLAYKKILIVSPRDFMYVRYTFKKDNQNWSIATSIPDIPTITGKQRGTIILTATQAIQKDNKLYLTVYSHVDMKMPVKASAAKARGTTEIKKYLDKCYNYVKNQSHNMI